MSSDEALLDTRKKLGRPAGKIWNWFEKDEQVSKGCYSATCTFCENHWAIAKPSKLKRHLGYECKNVDNDTRIKVLKLLLSEKADSDEDTNSTSVARISRRRVVPLTNDDEDYEKLPTSSE